MSTFFKVLLVILIILVIALVVLYFVGRKMQRKQAAQQEQMEAAKQSVSMLVIDKKIMPLKQSGLPQIVIDQTPKLMRRSKLPIVKAKVGPRIMTLVADSAIFGKRRSDCTPLRLFPTRVDARRNDPNVVDRADLAHCLLDSLFNVTSNITDS